MTRQVAWPHPGEILRDEFLVPLGLSQYRLAKEISVPPGRIGEIVAGSRSISVETDLRLARFFGTSEGFWTNLQADFDRHQAKETLGDALDAIRRYTPTLEHA